MLAPLVGVALVQGVARPVKNFVVEGEPAEERADAPPNVRC